MNEKSERNWRKWDMDDAKCNQCIHFGAYDQCRLKKKWVGFDNPRCKMHFEPRQIPPPDGHCFYRSWYEGRRFCEAGDHVCIGDPRCDRALPRERKDAEA